MMLHDTLLQQLRWRYAVQKFDPDRPVDAATWETLERALVLTASGFGLQPWRFIVITDPAVKADLVQHSFGQQQVKDASHLIVFAIRQQVDDGHLDRHIDRMAELRQQQREQHAGYRQVAKGYFSRLDADGHAKWAGRQVYLALGAFLTAAALLGVDTCPMEGIDPAGYDRRLDLTAEGLSTVVVAAAGHRSADDPRAKLPKVRFAHDEVVRHV